MIDYAMSIADYLRSPALSSGALRDLMVSPSLYYGRHLAHARGDFGAVIHDDGESASSALGTAFHALVLEGDDAYGERVAVWRGGPTEKGSHSKHRGTKFYKETWEPDARARGFTIIDEEDHDLVTAMHEAVLAHADALKLLYDCPGRSEVTLFFEQAGIPCRCRPDRVLEDLDIIVELKTARSTLDRDIERQATELGYHIKAEWARRAYKQCYGRELREYVFVSVPTTKPLRDVVVWTSSSMEIAAMQIDRALADLIDRTAQDDWTPRRCNGIQSYGIPLWALEHDIRSQLEG